MRETIKTKYDGKDFEFLAVLNLLEERKQKQEAIKLIGGFEQYAALEVAIKKAYDLHIGFNEKKYGVEGFREKQNEVTELQKENPDEALKLYMELSNNQFYMSFTELVKTKTEVEDYAYLIVSCIKPVNFNFDEKSENYMQEILGSIEQQKVESLKKKQDSKD